MPNLQPALEPTVLSADATAFLDAVVCDGRYVFNVNERPIDVAEALDLEITPDVAEQVASKPLEDLAPALWESKLLAHDPSRMNAAALAALVVPVGPGVAALIVVGVVVGVVVVRTRRSKRLAIVDNSAHKDYKL